MNVRIILHAQSTTDAPRKAVLWTIGASSTLVKGYNLLYEVRRVSGYTQQYSTTWGMLCLAPWQGTPTNRNTVVSKPAATEGTLYEGATKEAKECVLTIVGVGGAGSGIRMVGRLEGARQDGGGFGNVKGVTEGTLNASRKERRSVRVKKMESEGRECKQ